jgi:hypothetical protein
LILQHRALVGMAPSADSKITHVKHKPFIG